MDLNAPQPPENIIEHMIDKMGIGLFLNSTVEICYQDASMIGIKAIAKVSVSEDGKNWLSSKLESGGLWGIYVGWGKEYDSIIKEEAEGQYEELKTELKTYGFKRIPAFKEDMIDDSIN